MRSSAKLLAVLTLLSPFLKATTITPTLSVDTMQAPDYSTVVVPRLPLFSAPTLPVPVAPLPPIIGNTTILNPQPVTPVPVSTPTLTPTPTTTSISTPTPSPSFTPPVDNQTQTVTTQLLQNATPTGINLQSSPSPTFMPMMAGNYITSPGAPQMNFATPQFALVTNIIAAATTTSTVPFSSPLQLDVTATAPEPGTWVLLLAGAIALMLGYRRRQLITVKTR